MIEKRRQSARRTWVLQNTAHPDTDRALIEQLIHRDHVIHFSEIIHTDSCRNCGPEVIPVGDIPFIAEWLKKTYGKGITPIEVPEILRTPEFLGRDYYFTDKDHLPYQSVLKRFIKNVSGLKVFHSALYEGDVPSYKVLPEGKYLVSGWLNIMSEYRVFVHKDQILAVQPYAGNPLIFPDPDIILKMVRTYQGDDTRPAAYTLDVAVSADDKRQLNTRILEIHPFVSCGLYGFESPEILDMLEDGIRYYTGV